MQRAVVLRVGVTIKQIENEHLQNLLVFRVWIIWGGTKNWGGTAPECPPWLRSWALVFEIMGAIRWGTRETGPPTFSDSGDIICHVPHIFLFRFGNILVLHQAVSLTFYNKIALMFETPGLTLKHFPYCYDTKILSPIFT